jgi:two-component system sensor histidine kinase YesM
MRFITLFIIFLIPLYFIGFSIYIFGRNSISGQNREAQANRAEFYINSLAAEVFWIRNLQLNFFSDIYLNRLAGTIDIMSNYERDMNALNVLNHLSVIKESSHYISEAAIMIPSIDRKITSHYAGRLDDLDWKYIDEYTSAPDVAVFYKSSIILLHASANRENAPNDRSMARYFFAIELSFDEIKQAMLGILQSGENSIWLQGDVDFLDTSFADRSIAEEIIQLNIPQGKTVSAVVHGKHYQVYRTVLDTTSLSYISVMDERVLYRRIDVYLWFILLFSLMTVTIILWFSYYFNKMIHVPLTELRTAFRKLENGVFDIQIEHSAQDEFHDIYDNFNHMTKELDQLINQLFRQKMLVQKAEIRQLQAQINPHFLFNCFFILSRRIQQGDMETAVSLANHLGEYFKFITRTARDDVPLAEEVQHARNYTRIQASRFAGRIAVVFDELPEAYSSLVVDRLIIQPIIENAFEHGLENKDENGMLGISFSGNGDVLTVSVEDNGDELDDADIERLRISLEASDDDFTDRPGPSAEPHRGEGSSFPDEITSMINIHRRIRHRMGTQAGLRINRGAMGGLLVELVLIRP